MDELIGVVKPFKTGKCLVVTIPVEAVHRLKIKPGQKLAVKLSQDKIVYEVIK
ncbi:MAG: hypothetical protein J7J91_06805 [Deltaproteobacteria bacterium]|nr:hypothetical protein [Deltaproteobacteria bacterium]